MSARASQILTQRRRSSKAHHLRPSPSTTPAKAATAPAYRPSRSRSPPATASNRILFAQVDFGDNADPVTGITYDAQALTFYKDIDASNIGGEGIWYLIGPPSGAHNMRRHLGFRRQYPLQAIAAISHAGVNQTGFPDAVGTGNPHTILHGHESFTER